MNLGKRSAVLIASGMAGALVLSGCGGGDGGADGGDEASSAVKSTVEQREVDDQLIAR